MRPRMVWLAVIIGLAGVLCSLRSIIRSKETPFFAILNGLSWLVASALVCVVMARACQLASGNWSGAKLAPVIAMTRGYSLYQDPDKGVMTGWIYGPVGALAMLPAALGKTPTTCGLIGAVIALACYFAPAAWLLWIAARGRFNAVAALALLVFGWWTMVSADLVDTSVIASPDSVVLGLSACACAALMLRRSTATLFAAALAAVLAGWAKQNYAGLIVGLFVWVLLEDGWKAAMRFAAITAAVGVVVSAGLIAFFGASNMWFHMVTLPSSHPFNHAERGIWVMWMTNLAKFLGPLMPAIALVLLTVLLNKVALPGGPTSFRSWLATRRWPMLAIVAISLAPGGFLGMAKVGGGENSLVGAHYFLLLSALSGVVMTCESMSASPTWQRGLKTTLAIIVLTLAVQGVLKPINNEISMWSKFAHPYQNGAEKVYLRSIQFPNTIYSPWNPLTTLLSENRLYHFDVGFFDRYSARRIPPTEQFAQHIPRDMRAIIFIEKVPGGLTEQIFPEFRNRVEIPELPNCILLVR